MHFEEYNGRVWELDKETELWLFILFLFECFFIVVFPFVGIFYVKGKDPEIDHHNEVYECPFGDLSIKTSEKFHRFGAYLFLLGLCFYLR